MRLTAAPPTDMRPTTPTPMAASPARRTGGRAGEGVARPGPDTRFSSGEAAAGWRLPVSRRVTEVTAVVTRPPSRASRGSGRGPTCGAAAAVLSSASAAAFVEMSTKFRDSFHNIIIHLNTIDHDRAICLSVCKSNH